MVIYSIPFNYILLSLTLGSLLEQSYQQSPYCGFNLPQIPSLKDWIQNVNSKKKPVIREEAETLKLPDILGFDVAEEKIDDAFEIPDLAEVVKSYGYPVEKHEVTTDDGYILTLLRIKYGKNGPDKDGSVRKPVLLQHGITDTAASYLGLSGCMAYYLADKGYDVWIGNSRGTKLSRRHVDISKDPDKEGTTYWDFSFHEMGVHDLPAVFQKIQEEASKQPVHYVGMSMGSTQFLVMGSELPQSLDMVDCVVLMAPVARPVHMQMTAGTLYYLSYTIVKALHIFSKSGELRLMEPQTADSILRFCTTQGIQKEICDKIIANTKGLLMSSPSDLENKMAIAKMAPLAASANSYIHFLQIVGSGKFQKFDYGRNENIVKYQKEQPPEYNLKNINKKLYLVVGGKDDVAVKEDVEWLRSQLPSAEIISEKFENYGHNDFYYNEDKETLFGTIVKIFTDWESKEEAEALAEENE